MRRSLIASILSVTAAASATGAQNVARGASVNGVIYDSLRSAPLAGAFIMIAGGNRNATSDANGRFRFDSLPAGEYVFFMQHPALDSIGFSEWSVRAAVSDGRDTLRLSLPSFTNLWSTACGRPEPPLNADLLFGTIHRVGKADPVAGALVEVSWFELAADDKTGIAHTRVGGSVHSDAVGIYRVCDAPRGVALRITATGDSAAAGIIDLAPSAVRVQRRDLLLGSTRSAESVLRGTISGSVRGTDDRPLAAARVFADELPESRTDANGRFIIRDVPPGTRQVRVLAIGASPLAAAVDVVPNDTATLDVRLSRATVLDTTRVTASTVRQHWVTDINDRRKLGLGRFMDSTRIQGHGDVFSALSEIRPHPCPLVLWIDRIKFTGSDAPKEMRLLQPSEIGVMEWYERNPPPEFGKSSCTLVVWTKRALPH